MKVMSRPITALWLLLCIIPCSPAFITSHSTRHRRIYTNTDLAANSAENCLDRQRSAPAWTLPKPAIQSYVEGKDEDAPEPAKPLIENANIEDVVISNINSYDLVTNTESDEYDEISSTSTIDIDLSGCTKEDIEADNGKEVESFAIASDDAVLSSSKSSKTNTSEDHAESAGYSLKSGKAVWDNEGETAVLKYEDGKKIQEHVYSKAEELIEKSDPIIASFKHGKTEELNDKANSSDTSSKPSAHILAFVDGNTESFYDEYAYFHELWKETDIDMQPLVSDSLG